MADQIDNTGRENDRTSARADSKPGTGVASEPGGGSIDPSVTGTNTEAGATADSDAAASANHADGRVGNTATGATLDAMDTSGNNPD